MSTPGKLVLSTGNSYNDGEFRFFAAGKMPIAMREQALCRHGSGTLCYSAAYQQGLRHFGNESAFIGFQQKYGYIFVLGDPVACDDTREAIVSAFLQRKKRAAFCQIGDATAEVLSRRGFWINQMGIDSRIDLPDFDFDGKEKERFRYASNWLQRRNYTVTELPFAGNVVEQTKQLDTQWRATRTIKKRETAFINRPMSYEHQTDMRHFFLLSPNGNIVAFVFFDPLYRDNNVIGYATSFKRRQPDAPAMAEAGICKAAIEQFKQEGREVVRLGLSPLAEIEDGRFKHNWIMQRSFKYCFGASWSNRYFYNLQGHAAFKNRFRGHKEKTYFASPSFVNDLRLVALLRLCRIL